MRWEVDGKAAKNLRVQKFIQPLLDHLLVVIPGCVAGFLETLPQEDKEILQNMDVQQRPGAGEERPPQIPLDCIPRVMIAVTPQERCEMILSRFAMLHGKFPDVCTEALTRFYIMSDRRDADVREALLQALELGFVGHRLYTADFLDAFLCYFSETPLYQGICTEFLEMGQQLELMSEVICPMLPNIERLRGRTFLDLMMASVLRREALGEDFQRCFEETCRRLFDGKDLENLGIFFCAVPFPIAVLPECVDFINKCPYCEDTDRRFWFRKLISWFLADDCMVVIRNAGRFLLGVFWEDIVSHALSLPEAGNLEYLIVMMEAVMGADDMVLIKQLPAVWYKVLNIQEDLENGMGEEQMLFIQERLIRFIKHLYDVADVADVADPILYSLVKKPEDGDDTDYGAQTLKVMFGTDGQEIVNAFSGDKADRLASAIVF